MMLDVAVNGVVWTNRGAVYLDISEWAWIHIIVGGLVVLAGIAVGVVVMYATGLLIAG